MFCLTLETVAGQVLGGVPERTSLYRIHAGDEIDIKFFYNPDLNERVTIRPDGRLSLQLIPEVTAAGKSTAELARQLEALYAPVLAEPRISILVRSFPSQRIFVDGEVIRPGMFQLVNQMKLSQAIAAAGGLKETAYAKQILVLRQGERAPVSLNFDLSAYRKGRPLAEDPALQPEDVVFVARSKIANVNLWIDQYIRRSIPISTGMFWNVF
jgi:protein involved in polysaccharide export with SLBB domain